jgi:hypothetical protein
LKRQLDSTTIELRIGPHRARPGWGVARITFNGDRPDHIQQIDAAIKAMVEARSGVQAPAESRRGAVEVPV